MIFAYKFTWLKATYYSMYAYFRKNPLTTITTILIFMYMTKWWLVQQREYFESKTPTTPKTKTTTTTPTPETAEISQLHVTVDNLSKKVADIDKRLSTIESQITALKNAAAASAKK